MHPTSLEAGMTTKTLLWWGAGLALAVSACDGEPEAKGDVRAPKAIEVDATEANRRLERGVADVGRKLGDAAEAAARSEEVERAGQAVDDAARELSQEARQGAREAGKRLERGAREIAKEAGQALEEAGEDLQDRAEPPDAGR
jgi:hypothetical protein